MRIQTRGNPWFPEPVKPDSQSMEFMLSTWVLKPIPYHHFNQRQIKPCFLRDIYVVTLNNREDLPDPTLGNFSMKAAAGCRSNAFSRRRTRVNVDEQVRMDKVD